MKNKVYDSRQAEVDALQREEQKLLRRSKGRRAARVLDRIFGFLLATAVLACLDYGDPDYVYSAALLACTHLGNALARADGEAWEKICDGLDENVKRDLVLRGAYWRQFETPVRKASNTVYEGFLYSYDQTLGLRSYGACVDLLVNYYYEDSLK